MAVFEHVSKISPMLHTVDRYTVPEYNKIHDYVQSGEMWNTVLKSHDNFIGTVQRRSTEQKY